MRINPALTLLQALVLNQQQAQVSGLILSQALKHRLAPGIGGPGYGLLVEMVALTLILHSAAQDRRSIRLGHRLPSKSISDIGPLWVWAGRLRLFHLLQHIAEEFVVVDLVVADVAQELLEFRILQLLNMFLVVFDLRFQIWDLQSAINLAL